MQVNIHNFLWEIAIFSKTKIFSEKTDIDLHFENLYNVWLIEYTWICMSVPEFSLWSHVFTKNMKKIC